MIQEELDIAEGADTVAGPGIVEHFGTAEELDIVAVGCHNSVGSCQYFVGRSQIDYCSAVGNYLHRAEVHRLVLWMNHGLHDRLCRLYLRDC